MSKLEGNSVKVGNTHSTVAVSHEDLAQIHKLCEIDERSVKSIVKIALKKYFEIRGDCFHDVKSETTEVLHGGFVQ
jgi:hypothetical protein|tara:strand:+ start:409 stop:636 length:228 start_codon:yes stop_codon:yes gene_type:complete